MNTVSAITVRRFRKFCKPGVCGFILLLFLGKANISWAQTRELASMNSYSRGMLFSTDAVTVDSLQSEELMLEGVKEKIIGNLVLAEDYFTQSIHADPHNDASLYELSLIRISKKDFPQAKSYIQRALEVKPREPYYLKALIEVNSAMMDTLALIQNFSKLIESEPGKPEAYLSKADILIHQGKLNEAIEVYNLYEKLSADYELAELQKQKIYLSHNQPRKALESMKFLLIQAPGVNKYYLLESEIYRTLGLQDSSFICLNEAKKINSEDGFLDLGYFEYYASSGQYALADSALIKIFASDDIGTNQKARILEDYYLQKNMGGDSIAIQLINQLLEDNPENKELKSLKERIWLKSLKGNSEDRHKLGALLEKDGGDFKSWSKLVSLDYEAKDNAALLKHSSEALELYPFQLSLYWYKARALRQNSQFELAEKSLIKAIKLGEADKASSAVLWEELGETYHMEGKYELSDSAFNQSLQYAENPIVLNNFAYYLSLRKVKLDIADHMAHRANELESKNANFEDTYAWILFQEKNFDNALIWMERAIQDDKNQSPTFWDHYGDILLGSGKKSKALDAWKKALSLGSKNVHLQEKIKSVHP